MAVLKLKATGRKASGTEFGPTFAGQVVRVNRFQTLIAVDATVADLSSQERNVAKHAKKHPDEPNLMEVDLNGKEIGDEGMREVLGAIMLTLVDHSNFYLEELHLSTNGLTTGILPVLSQIIQRSSFDLTALDLSGNAICVLTDEHARDWEQFLDSFAKCRVMRRLDLSGNDFSKSIAMELLCRVYFSHRPIDPNELEGSALTDDDMAVSRELQGSKLIEKTNSLTLEQPEDLNGSEISLSKAIILKRREGLRSIPYIVLRNVGMDDAGVLWLSKILGQHYWPQYLMTNLKEGTLAAKVMKEDASAGLFGIIYVDNPSITATGLKALQMAEQARVELAGISEMSGHDKDDFEDAVDFAKLSRKDQMEHLRKKLQRTTIEAVGVNGVELWAAALHLMNLTRAIVPSTASRRRHPDVVAPMPVAGPDEEIVEAPVDTPQSVVPPFFNRPTSPRMSDSDFPAFPYKTLRIITTANGSAAVVDPGPLKPSRGKGLAPRSSPIKNSPSLPLFKSPSNSPLNTDLITNTFRNLDKVDKESHTPPRDQLVKKSEDWPMGLHEHLWIEALMQVGRDCGVLNTRQVESVVEYAGDRDSLRVEMEGMGRTKSVQIWGVLERMGCLEYEMEM